MFTSFVTTLHFACSLIAPNIIVKTTPQLWLLWYAMADGLAYTVYALEYMDNVCGCALWCVPLLDDDVQVVQLS